LGAVLFAYSVLIGAEQVPETTLRFVIMVWLMPIAILWWVQTESADTMSEELKWLFVLFGFFVIPYYLLRTRRLRPFQSTALVALALLAPYLGYLAGGLAPVVGVVPRYYRLTKDGPFERLTPALGERLVHRDATSVCGLIGAEVAAGRGIPKDADDLYERWRRSHPREPVPLDPFTANSYWYIRGATAYGLKSVGPDGKMDTDDDIIYKCPASVPARRDSA